MKTNTELEIKLKTGRITQVKVKSISGNTCKLLVECDIPVVNHKMDDAFVLIPASKLRLSDKIMSHVPATKKQEIFKEKLTKIIESGIKDFYKAIYDPSTSLDNKSICFDVGNRPAIGMTCEWWQKAAKEFLPERKSRLGTEDEYYAFLAVLMKKMVNHGYTVNKAWKVICDDSKSIGHYINSDHSKNEFEMTGSREFMGFCDLANTYKILLSNSSSRDFCVAGGCYEHYGDYYPLSDVGFSGTNEPRHLCVGWIVLTK